MKIRAYVFTHNNPTQTHVAMEELMTSDPSVRYCVYQTESGTNNVRHYQGYVELKNPQRLSYMKKLLPGAHFEKRRGTRDQARDYAMKEDTRTEGPFEIGEWPAGGSGTRTDLNAAIVTATESLDIATVAKEHPVEFVKYSRGLAQLIFYTRPERDRTVAPSVRYPNLMMGLKVRLIVAVGTPLLRKHRLWQNS